MIAKNCAVLLLLLLGKEHFQCPNGTISTFSGKHAPKWGACPGNLIFEDNFTNLDMTKWEHELTLRGGEVEEFQWYVNNRSNTFTKDGILHIRPTLTSDVIGESNLSHGVVDVRGGTPASSCTSNLHEGCRKRGTPDKIINPIRSARIRTVRSFNFKYGKVEVRAKLPTGDWLWPAIWLLPELQAYGNGPLSGKIALMESRSNRNLTQKSINIGSEQYAATLHWGLDSHHNAWRKTHFLVNSRSGQGFDKEFYHFQMEWAPDYIDFYLDDELIGTVQPNMSFWYWGEFNKTGYENPWQYDKPNAPFDQQFYLSINLAVGGVSGYFPDEAENTSPKPWKNNSTTAMRDFWNNRTDWLPTWEMKKNGGESSSFLIDYVRVWAI